ncbi:Helix-turn-helix domain protein [compost metagenome]
MSERTLYAQFERRLGKAPKHYIQQKKMERIRHCLSDPACNVRGVTEIALDYGFSHLGRFSEQYKKRFAEAPSDTLRNRGLRAELVAPHRGATLPQTS